MAPSIDSRVTSTTRSASSGTRAEVIARPGSVVATRTSRCVPGRRRSSMTPIRRTGWAIGALPEVLVEHRRAVVVVPRAHCRGLARVERALQLLATGTHQLHRPLEHDL